MLKRSWIRTLFARPVTRTIRKALRRAHPSLETLEDRCVPSTFTVNSLLDDGSVGTLRWAVGQANASGGAQAIAFDNTVFNTAKTIALSGTQLELSDATGPETITGPAAGVTVNGNNASRVFQVDGLVTASISGLTISRGKPPGSYVSGGGLLNSGTLTLTNCTVSGNSANSGGGVFNGYFATLTLANCTVSGNKASGYGGGLDIAFGGTTTLTNCAVSGNSANSGGGVFNSYFATTTLTNCTVSGNSAAVGGGIANQGTLNVASSTINKNHASSVGGGISTTSFGSSATITNSVINANQVDSSGAALGGGINCYNSSLSLTGCRVNANQAKGTNAYGGGISAINSTVNVQSSTVSGNKANGSVVGEGGGIYAFSSVLTLVDSTVKGNKATTAYDNIFDGP